MSFNKKSSQPDNTAARTALWRALHVLTDAEPHIIEDMIGLKLIAPDDDWQERPDMKYTRRLRASVVARARFIEDLIIEENKNGITQYALLGAGLDSFAQRRTDKAAPIQVFEIDQAGTLAWKKQRLIETGFSIPGNLHFVPVDFEKDNWLQQLLKAGFDKDNPAVIACTGVTLYLTKEAIVETLQQIATLATGSVLAMTFYLPLELMDEEDKPLMEMSLKGAAAAGTPMKSFFSAGEVLKMAIDVGFREAKTVSTKDMEQLYFANRTDGLLPASGEVFLIAKI
jgi:methyltransferase (TIGR00027 family)